MEAEVEMHILGGASAHIKAVGSTPIPHQSKTSWGENYNSRYDFYDECIDVLELPSDAFSCDYIHAGTRTEKSIHQCVCLCTSAYFVVMCVCMLFT